MTLKTINKIKKEILKEIKHRRISTTCGYGISIKENKEREKRGEPVELSEWIEWYFNKLKKEQDEKC